MKFRISSNFTENKYFGILNPNTEDFLMPYEKDLGVDPDPSLVYSYNNFGFRCEDFVKNHNGLHILFAGCSETEGAANKLEDTWSHILYSKIKKSEDMSGYYNVGKAGLTISAIVMNIFQYIDDFGLPDCIFVQFPDQTRYVTWSQEDGFYPKYQVLGDNVSNIEWDIFFTKHDDPKALNINILYNYLLLKNLIQFCKINSIRLIWSSWHHPSIEKFSSDTSLLDGYINTSTLNKEHWDIKIKDLKARDGYHFGRGFHKIWADQFYKEFLNDKDHKKNNS